MNPPKTLDSAAPSVSSVNRESQARVRLNACRIQASGHMERATVDLLNAIDDKLFALSEEQREQPLPVDIYDLLRDFRVAKSRLENQFRRRFSETFAACLDDHLELPSDLPSTAFSRRLNDRTGQNAQLNPVDLVLTIDADCKHEITQLDPLLKQLCKQAGYRGDINPLGAHMIAASYISLAKFIEAEIQLQPMTPLMFEQHLVPHLKTMYADVYEDLALTGIGGKTNAVSKPNIPSPQQPFHRRLDESGLIDELTRLQKLDFSNAADLNLDFGPETIEDPSTSFLRQLKSTEIGRSLLKDHELTIELTAMFFDQIYGDKNFADEFRPLIGRLQIPLLKVAILDRSLFTKRNNPARVMLSRLYEIGQVWTLSEVPSPAIVNHVDTLTRALTQQFGRNTELFPRLIDKMKPLSVWAETQRNMLPQEDPASVRRNKDIAAGLNRLNKSKSAVFLTVQQRINNFSLPDPVENFIKEQWTSLLVVTHFKEGENSQEWSFAVKSLDALIWSIQPKESDESRDKLTKLKPSLIKRLKEGAQRISMPSNEIDRFLNALSSLHELAMMNVRPSEHVEIDSLRKETMPPTESRGNSDDQSVDRTSPTVHQFPPVNRVRNNAPKPAPQISSAEQAIEEIILSSDEDGTGPAGDDPSLEQVHNLTPGTWVRFTDNDSENSELGRLVWINKSTGKYVFSNQRGKKIAERTAVQLANELRNNKVSIIDQTTERMQSQSEIKSAD